MEGVDDILVREAPIPNAETPEGQVRLGLRLLERASLFQFGRLYRTASPEVRAALRGPLTEKAKTYLSACRKEGFWHTEMDDFYALVSDTGFEDDDVFMQLSSAALRAEVEGATLSDLEFSVRALRFLTEGNHWYVRSRPELHLMHAETALAEKLVVQAGRNTPANGPTSVAQLERAIALFEKHGLEEQAANARVRLEAAARAPGATERAARRGESRASRSVREEVAPNTPSPPVPMTHRFGPSDLPGSTPPGRPAEPVDPVGRPRYPSFEASLEKMLTPQPAEQLRVKDLRALREMGAEGYVQRSLALARRIQELALHVAKEVAPKGPLIYGQSTNMDVEIQSSIESLKLGDVITSPDARDPLDVGLRSHGAPIAFTVDDGGDEARAWVHPVIWERVHPVLTQEERDFLALARRKQAFELHHEQLDRARAQANAARTQAEKLGLDPDHPDVFTGGAERR